MKHLLVSFLLMNAIVVSAQSQKLRIESEIRPRIIVNGGYKTPVAKSDDNRTYTTQRTRLNALFVNNNFESYISLQDVRLWGADDNYNSSGVYGSTESLCLHQAWAKLNLDKHFSIKVGRQLFSYDDQRILAARNWNDYQVTYDALLLEYKNGKHRLHAAITCNAESKSASTYADEKFKSFNFLHYQYKSKRFTISALALETGNTFSDTTDNVFYRTTCGVNSTYKSKGTRVKASAYFQHNLNNLGGKVSAYCFALYAEQKLHEKLNIGVGIDYLSGNDETSTSATDMQFDILYGRRHGFYGYMDYFSTTPEQGLQDYMAKLIYKPAKNIKVQLHWHYFRLAADRLDDDNSAKILDKNLGQEVDLKVNWAFHKMAKLECGYSVFGLTNTLEQIKGVSGTSYKTPQYCYLMLSFVPYFELR